MIDGALITFSINICVEISLVPELVTKGTVQKCNFTIYRDNIVQDDYFSTFSYFNYPFNHSKTVFAYPGR